MDKLDKQRKILTDILDELEEYGEVLVSDEEIENMPFRFDEALQHWHRLMGGTIWVSRDMPSFEITVRWEEA